MPIENSNPVTVHSTYDQWWISNFQVFASDPSKPVKVHAVFAPYDGSSILLNRAVAYDITDLFALAGQNSDVANAVGTLLATLGTLAKSAGKIS